MIASRFKIFLTITSSPGSRSVAKGAAVSDASGVGDPTGSDPANWANPPRFWKLNGLLDPPKFDNSAARLLFPSSVKCFATHNVPITTCYLQAAGFLLSSAALVFPWGIGGIWLSRSEKAVCWTAAFCMDEQLDGISQILSESPETIHTWQYCKIKCCINEALLMKKVVVYFHTFANNKSMDDDIYIFIVKGVGPSSFI